MLKAENTSIRSVSQRRTANLGDAKPRLHSRVDRHLSVLRDTTLDSVAVRVGTRKTYSRLRSFKPRTLVLVRDSSSKCDPPLYESIVVPIDVGRRVI